MKTITFNQLKISNFKGIEQRSIQFNHRTDLRGANGTGKTTIADAIWWVLFGKDSGGLTSFPVKRKDAAGEDIREIIVEVELSLNVDGMNHLFRRVQEENWVTKRGSISRVFEGNVQTLYYNESKMKTDEYSKAVSAIVDENRFKMLTSPTYFMNQLDDKKRREELMKLIGNESDIEKALLQTSDFAMLRKEWTKDININKSFVNMQEFIRQKARSNADEIDRLPYQIDELQKTITDEYDETTIKSLISGYKRDLENLIEPKPYEKPESVVSAEETLRQTQKELDVMKDEAYNKFVSKRREITIARQEVTSMIASFLGKKTLLQNDLDYNRISVSAKSREKDELLKQYNQLKNQAFIAPKVDLTCPACGQLLPGMDPEVIIERSRISFENDRKAKIDEILVKGNTLRAEIDQLAKAAQEIESNKFALESQLEDLNRQLEALPNPDSVLEHDFIDGKLKDELQVKITELTDIINAWRNASNDDSAKLEYRIKRDELIAKINENSFRYGKLESQKATLQRIEELKGRETILLQERDYFKTIGFQAELFMKSKNEALEESLSSHFTTVKWRLFKQQVNGGFQQVCDAYLNGKPYDAQSTGERIFTGIDIIKTFQGIYGINAPLLIDNRESITLPVDAQCQIISMYADDRYNELQQF